MDTELMNYINNLINQLLERGAIETQSLSQNEFMYLMSELRKRRIPVEVIVMPHWRTEIYMNRYVRRKLSVKRIVRVRQ